MAYAAIPTSDGGFVLGGYTTTTGMGDFYQLKTDGNGVILWEQTFGDSDRYESARWMIETSDGGYILAGGRADDFPYGSNSDVYMVKTDVNGSYEWSSIIGYDSVSESANCIAQTLDGGYIICGSYWATSQTSYDIFLIKTNVLGVQEWREVISLEEGMADYGVSVIPATDGGYIVTGQTQALSGDYSYNAFIMKTDGLGNLSWLETYGDSWPWYEDAYHIIHTTDGGFLVCGNQNNDGLDNNWYVFKTDGIGSEIWSDNTIGGVYHDKSFFASETNDGGYVVTGTYHQDVWHAYIAKFSVDGDILWTKMWGTDDDNSQGNNTITQLSDGGFITAGSTTNNNGNHDIYLTRLSPETVGYDIKTNKFHVEQIVLHPCQPNPFRNSTTIHFEVANRSNLSITIYDVFGQRIKELVNSEYNIGKHEIQLDANKMPPGIYYCILKHGEYSTGTKLIRK